MMSEQQDKGEFERIADVFTTLKDFDPTMERIADAFTALGEAVRKLDELDAPTFELVEALRKDYPAVRVLEDGSIAVLTRLYSTMAVCLGVDRHGWATRFCYTDPIKAIEVLCALKSEDDVPEGWVSSRPKRDPA